MINDGQKVDAANSNAAFVSKTANSDIIGIPSLKNDDAGSGAHVENPQKAINKIFDATGIAGEDDADSNNYTSPQKIQNGDTYKEAIEKIDTAVSALENDSMDINGDKTFNGTTTFEGDVIIRGTTTTVNSTDLEVEDQNITLNLGGNDASAETAGLDIERTNPADNGSIRFDSGLASFWKIGILSAMKEIIVSGVAQTIAGIKTFSSNIISSATTQSTDKDSGAFVTEGGIGVEKNANIGGALGVTGNSLFSGGSQHELELLLKEIGTPSNPAAGYRKFYPKSDGLYTKDSAGLETKVGSGGDGEIYASAGGDKTLTVASKELLVITGAATISTFAPVVTTLQAGQQFVIQNESTVVQNVMASAASGGISIVSIRPKSRAIITCIDIVSDGASAWKFQVIYGLSDMTSILTTGGTTTLNFSTSTRTIAFTGTNNQNLQLPNGTTGVYGINAQGYDYHIVNESTGYITVLHNSGSVLKVMSPGSSALLKVKQIGVSDGFDMVAYHAPANGTDNLLSGGDGELGTTGWTVDSVAAATRPAGALTGTTTGITVAVSSTAPLNRGQSLTIAKDASNRQGRLVYKNFNVPVVSRAKPHQLSLTYQVSSGTFVAGTQTTDSDAIVYIREYNGSTYTWREPSSFKFLSNTSTLTDEIQAEFQFNHDTISADFVVYFCSTSAVAYTLKLDEIRILRTVIPTGASKADLGTLAVTLAGAGNATSVFKGIKDGSFLILDGVINIGATPPSTVIEFILPGGYAVNYNKAAYSTGGSSNGVQQMGTCAAYTNSTGAGNTGFVTPSTGAPSNTFRMVGDDGSGFWSNSVPYVFSSANADRIHIQARIPIIGWEEVARMSHDSSTRVVSSTISGSATSISSSVTTVIPTTVVKDTHGAWNAAAGTFTAPVSGFYNIAINSQTGVSNTYFEGGYSVDGSGYFLIGGSRSSAGLTSMYASGTAKVFLNQGQVIRIRYQQSGTGTMSTFTASIGMDSGPAQIAASEFIGARYVTAVAQSIASGANAVVDYLTKSYDTHGCVTVGAGVWKFTAPRAGKYQIDARAQYGAQSWTAGDQTNMQIFKNGVQACVNQKEFHGTGTFFDQVECHDTFELIAGDYIQIIVGQNTGTARLLEANANCNVVTIKSVG